MAITYRKFRGIALPASLAALGPEASSMRNILQHGGLVHLIARDAGPQGGCHFAGLRPAVTATYAGSASAKERFILHRSGEFTIRDGR